VSENPLCADCFAAGRYVETKEVHHLRKLASHPGLRFDWANCLGLCKHCHGVRTARGE
jgi:5-methylcytosine-specific restriction endonuclease McrA